MKPTEVIRAIAYPLVEPAVLVPLLVFWLLLLIVGAAGLLGMFLLVIVIPAVFRYQVIVLEARARGVRPATPDIEFFRWFGNAWTLFPVPVALLLIALTVEIAQRFGTGWATVFLLSASIFFTASIAVLAITQSPLQSLNPVALYRLLRQCGDTLWIAIAFLFVAVWLSLEAEALPSMLASLVQLALSFSFFSLVGSLIEPYGLVEDVDIPAPLEKTASEIDTDIEKARTHALNHAYGFISRDNRDGGFRHLFEQIEKDPDPVAAWAWYFSQMLAWENKNHALFFAQHYLHDMLHYGEHVAAVKLIQRCRLVDEQWKPQREDLPAAIEAAESIGLNDLAAVLKRY